MLRAGVLRVAALFLFSTSEKAPKANFVENPFYALG
jgi:hypothetical protein